MDLQSIGFIVFIILLSLFIYLKRKNLQMQKVFFPLLYILLYKSKVGLKLMDTISGRFRKTMKVLALIGVGIGYIGMVLIAVMLIKNLIDRFTGPEAAAGVQLVLPIKVKGTFYVPFFYWIFSIAIIAAIHEFAHGVVARAYNMKIKSSGFAFVSLLVPILPAAFVEPDEKELSKRPAKEQLSVFAAGPFSNIILGFLVVFIFMFTINGAIGFFYEGTGINITGFVESSNLQPAQIAGISVGEKITIIEGTTVKTLEEFVEVLNTKSPGDNINIITTDGSYDVSLGKNPDNPSSPYLGVYLEGDTIVKQSITDKLGVFGTVLANIVLWIYGLLYWLYLLSIGIGLFNLVPLGPVDGGRMLLVTLKKFMKEEKAVKLWGRVSSLFLVLVLANILMAFF